MPETKHPDYANHSLLTMISRCLSGQWLIDPTWLMQHSDLLLRADKGEDMSGVWPKMQAGLFTKSDGLYSAAAADAKLGKGQALGVITLTGPVYKYGWNSSKSILNALSAMASDDRVGGVKLIVDSPGGQVHGTRELYETILNFPKPVLSVVDGYMASAAYYLSAGSSRIVAIQPNDQIGSIGTYQTMMDWNAFYAAFGIDVYEIYAKASSQKNEEYRQVIESKGKNTELAQKQITAYNDQFLADVKAGRGERLTGKGQDPLKGRLFFPSDAIENGLIDDQVSERDTLALLADMIATNKQTSIDMSLLSDFKQLLSKHDTEGEGKSNEGQTVEQLSQQLTAVTAERDGLKTENATLKTTNQEQATKITEQATKITGLEAEVARLGSQPGAMGTVTTKEKDETPKGEGEQKTSAEILKGLSFEQEATAMFGE